MKTTQILYFLPIFWIMGFSFFNYIWILLYSLLNWSHFQFYGVSCGTIWCAFISDWLCCYLYIPVITSTCRVLYKYVYSLWFIFNLRFIVVILFTLIFPHILHIKLNKCNLLKLSVVSINLLVPMDFQMIWLSNLLTMGVPAEGYSRHASSTYNFITTICQIFSPLALTMFYLYLCLKLNLK